MSARDPPCVGRAHSGDDGSDALHTAIRDAIGPCVGTALGEAYRVEVTSPIRLVEFPADDAARARRFWTGVLDVELEDRLDDEGEGWQTHGGGPALGLHPRGTGPGDRVSLPYFWVPDMDVALKRVSDLGGEVIHPGERWSVCRDTEGSPFGLAVDPT